MPEISNFYGIKIMMFFEDHQPPHFHAQYGDDKALIDINKGEIFRGRLPKAQAKMVLAWCEIHKTELLENWNRALNSETPVRINPLI